MWVFLGPFNLTLQGQKEKWRENKWFNMQQS